jgi:methylmalonyl-CoA mutase cobalamin-binding subunit
MVTEIFADAEFLIGGNRPEHDIQAFELAGVQRVIGVLAIISA